MNATNDTRELRPARTPLAVLSIEDDPAFTELIRLALEDEGFVVRITRVQSESELEGALAAGHWDIALSDHSMPGFSSRDALRAITALGLDVPFIIVSGYIGEEAAVAAMRAGAHDYVPKASLGRLGVAVRSALLDAAARAALRQRESDLEALHAVAFAAGTSLDMDRLALFASARVRTLLNCDYAALHWWSPGSGVLERIARSADDVDPVRDIIAPGAGVTGAAFTTRESIVIDDYAAWSGRLIDARNTLASAAATPMTIGDQVFGVFTIGSWALRHFAPEEMRVLALFAAEVAPAIETSRLLGAAQHAARYDGLTGLPNRVLFTERLEAQLGLAAAEHKSFALLYADLDDFRGVNDAFGQQAGDAVLQELGVRLRRLVGMGDAVGRFGADEFAVLLPLGSDLAAGREAAGQSAEFFREPFLVGGQSVHLAASIGIVGFPEHGDEPNLLLQRAESAMFAAKRSQTRTRVYSEELDPLSQKRIALATDLRHAIAANQLVLHYQPQIDCATGAVVAAEALLRWAHPQRGLVPPMEFIPLAEKSGLILDITPWVVRDALRQLRQWRTAGIDMRISINVAMRNLHDPEFFGQVERLVVESGVEPEALTLEITEGTLMLEADRTLALLKQFRAMGIGMAIDDFGTGYSSLSYLARLPVSEVKIDKSFIMALTDPGNRAIVEAVIKLGRAFGLRVVAEGVEDGPTWEIIRALSCDLAQGYYLSKPLPADAFVRWLRARPS